MRITLKSEVVVYDLTGIPLVRNRVIAPGTYSVQRCGPLIAHSQDRWLALNNQPIGMPEEDLKKLDGQVVIEQD